ncbi:hypothetical protein E3U47_24585, partial [Pseudomonas sp. RIT623]
MPQTCRSRLAGEHRHSRCQPPRRLFRQQGWLLRGGVCRKRVGAGLPANTGIAGANHRAACFASKAGSYGAGF